MIAQLENETNPELKYEIDTLMKQNMSSVVYKNQTLELIEKYKCSIKEIWRVIKTIRIERFSRR